MKLIMYGVVLIVVVVLIILAAAVARTYKMERSSNQTLFGEGGSDMADLDGDYRGLADGYSGSWQGKTFHLADKGGINRFLNDGSLTDSYPFTMYLGKGLRDKDLDVIKLDYNQPENPWWLRFVLDEMVQVAPGKYLGKVHIHVMPGLTFTMGYFTVEKISTP